MSKKKTLKELQEFCKDKKIISKLNLMITTLEQISIEFTSEEFMFDAISIRANTLKNQIETLRKKINETVIEQEKKTNLFNELVKRLQNAGYNAKLRKDTLQIEVYGSDAKNAWAICIITTCKWQDPSKVQVMKMFGKIEEPFISSDVDELFIHVVQLCSQYMSRQRMLEDKTM